MPATLAQLDQYLQELETVARALDRKFERPRFGVNGPPVFRHAQQDDLLLSYLKCLRSLSSLNACVVLLHAGFVQEVGALCRCVDEFCEDVFFLATGLGEGGGPSPHQRTLVEEFFQEEFEDHAHPLPEAAARNRVPRARVQAGIARIPGHPVNPYDAQQLARTLSRAFSGYVHGAYVHIMEMYGGPDPDHCSFYLRGMRGTPRIEEWTTALGNYVYRASLALEVVARRCVDAEATQTLRTARNRFEQLTGLGAGDANEMLNQIRGR